MAEHASTQPDPTSDEPDAFDRLYEPGEPVTRAGEGRAHRTSADRDRRLSPGWAARFLAGTSASER